MQEESSQSVSQLVAPSKLCNSPQLVLHESLDGVVRDRYGSEVLLGEGGHGVGIPRDALTQPDRPHNHLRRHGKLVNQILPSP